MQGLFITGTDTGVGKTVLTAALVSIARQHGIDAVPMKPVQTGCDGTGEQLDTPDITACLRACAYDPAPDEIDDMCPYRFRTACSPHLAAAQVSEQIEMEPILEAFQSLQARHAAVVVEGAGGVLVPINGSETMLDVMRAMALPVILAARPGLGTINHALLSLTVLRAAGLSVRAVVLVQSTPEPMGIIEEDNLRTISNYGRVEVYRLPFMQDALSGPMDPTALEALAPLL